MTELDVAAVEDAVTTEIAALVAESPKFRVGGIEIDRVARAVSVDGNPVTLTAREYELLQYLALRSGRLLTRQELLSQVWGESYAGGPRTVDIHVSRLRRKLGRGLPLVTLRRAGYRLSEVAR